MKEIFVYADWEDLTQSLLVGMLRTEMTKGEEVFSFEYSKEWLKDDNKYNLDPDLNLFYGPQYVNDAKPNFGLFLDSSPDRWGRTLMTRRVALMQRQEKKEIKPLLESDYLLGVVDETRMGGLRFKLSQEGNYLAENNGFTVPPFTNIRELEQACLKIEDDSISLDENVQKWLNIILAPGSSLGGARPKANIRDMEGSLWIAKFPSKNDDIDVGAWEYLVNGLAKELDINVAIADAKVYSQKQHTFLTKRFDRTKEGKRIHFASAMTLLGLKDGASHKEGVSYLDLVDIIEQYGASTDKDLKELWKRIVFFVATSNTDDHLRNHGFLLTKKGWRLSPAYDINPNRNGSGLSLNINAYENTLDFDLCLSVAEYFRWPNRDAKTFIKKTKNVVSQWTEKAKQIKISAQQIQYMEPAFSRCNK